MSKTWVILGILLLVAIGGVCWSQAMARGEEARRVIEPIPATESVVRWEGTQLFLANGIAIDIPDVEGLIEPLEFLPEACKRGVALMDGRPVVLMKIHHGCGNDPVHYHLATVDLARLLIYRGEAKPTVKLPYVPEQSPGALDHEFGWDVSDFFVFRSCESMGAFEYDPSSN